jgi:hypothetical protein
MLRPAALLLALVTALLVAAAVFIYGELPRAGSPQSPVRFIGTNFPPLAHQHDDAEGYGFSGAALLDADGDGRPDLFIGGGSGAHDQIAMQTKAGWELRQVGDSVSNTYGVVAVDLNRDGHDDLVVTRENGTRLLLNNGRGDFTDATPDYVAAPVRDESVALSLAAGDVNGDGWIDLYESRFVRAGDYKPGLYNDPERNKRNRLWLGLGVGEDGRPKFRDATTESGVAGCCNTYASMLVDLDADGDLDLVTANDAGPVEIFENDGSGHFSAHDTAAFGVGFWMGLTAADYDNDGDIDLFFTNKGRNIPEWLIRGDRKDSQVFNGSYLLARNDGAFAFTDVTAAAGLKSWEFARGAVWSDFDADGLLDLALVGNDWRWPLFRWLPQPGRLFVQGPQGVFRDVAVAAGTANAHVGVAPLAGDLNLDGFPDLVLVNRKGPLRVLVNKGNDNHFLAVRLKTRDNAPAFGTRVEMRMKDGTHLTRELTAGEGFLSDQGDVLLFGFGRRTQIESMRVYWSTGSYTRIDDSPLDRYIGFVEPSESSGGRNVMIKNPLPEWAARQKNSSRKMCP